MDLATVLQFFFFFVHATTVLISDEDDFSVRSSLLYKEFERDFELLTSGENDNTHKIHTEIVIFV